jgi:hypothetical protein
VSYGTYHEEIKKSAERFFKETKNHQMEVLHNDGLYRHLRFREPRHSAYWFDLITWPGNLAFRGDGESYTFARANDMFHFFTQHELWKDGSVHINPQYWSEKLTSHNQSEVYDEEIFKDRLWEEVASMLEGGTVEKDQEERFRKAVTEMLENDDYSTDATAIQMLERFEFWNIEDHEYSYKYSSEKIGFDESWEWVSGCTAYEWWYLWACHGIVWGIKQYYEMFGRPHPSDQDAAVSWDVASRGVPIG